MSTKTSNTSSRASAANKHQSAAAYSALAEDLLRSATRSVSGYDLGRIIGQGHFGTVRLAVHRLTGTRVAIKQLPKDPAPDLLFRELQLHRRLRHPHVLALYEIIATETSIWLVSELCTGGELFDYLVETGRLSLEETRRVFGQIVLGVAYLHRNNIVHRDLKLENILLDGRLNVKIADLGFSREFDENRWMETWVGTVGYSAPEILSGKRYMGEEADIWSLGIILFTLLAGELPFDDDDDAVVKDKILRCDYDVPSWMDEDAASLLRDLLVLDPLQRPSIKSILSHAFFTREPLASDHKTKRQWHHDQASVLASIVTAAPTITDSATRLDATPQCSAVGDREDGLGARQDGPSSNDRHAAEANRPEPCPLRPTSNLSAPALHRSMSASSSAASITSHTGSIRTPSRTPSRTKRRSFSSNLSERAPLQPTTEEVSRTPVKYLAMLEETDQTPFSSAMDDVLLSSMALIGFDVGQIRHSVINNACDAPAALWWTLKHKADDRRDMLKSPLPSRQSSLRRRPSDDPPGAEEKTSPPVLNRPSDDYLLKTPTRMDKTEPALKTPIARPLPLDYFEAEPKLPLPSPDTKVVGAQPTSPLSPASCARNPQSRGDDNLHDNSPPLPRRPRSASTNMVGRLFPRKSSLPTDLFDESTSTLVRFGSSSQLSARKQTSKPAKKILSQLKLWFIPNDYRSAALRRSSSTSTRKVVRGGSLGHECFDPSSRGASSAAPSRRSSLGNGGRPRHVAADQPRRRASNASRNSTSERGLSRPASTRSLSATEVPGAPRARTSPRNASAASSLHTSASPSNLANRHTPTSTTVQRRRAGSNQHRRGHSRHASTTSSLLTRHSSRSSEDDDILVPDSRRDLAHAVGADTVPQLHQRARAGKQSVAPWEKASAHRSDSATSLTSLDSSTTSRTGVHPIFTAHKTHHLFGHPTQPTSTTHKYSSRGSSSARLAERRPVRDVFARKDAEGDWIDDDIAGYGGGLGQLAHRDLDAGRAADSGSSVPIVAASTTFEGRYRGLGGTAEAKKFQGAAAIVEEEEAEEG